jgi:ATP-dependent DNA ligase
MDDALPKYVQAHSAKASAMDLSSWLLDNPLPAICEPKYEGLRVFFFKSGDHLVVSGRLGTIFSPASSPAVFSKVPELVHAPKRMILDGEYLAKEGLHLFDLLQIDDRDLKPLPLLRRKEMLSKILVDSGLEVPYVWAETAEEIQRYSQETISRGGEGIIVKNPHSFYRQPDSWLKIGRFDTMDCFVIDFQQAGDRMTWSVGAYDSQGKVVILGGVAALAERVDPNKVRLGSVVEVRFHLADGRVSVEFIARIRRDKLASECTLSQIPQLERKKELLP